MGSGSPKDGRETDAVKGYQAAAPAMFTDVEATSSAEPLGLGGRIPRRHEEEAYCRGSQRARREGGERQKGWAGS